MASTAQELVAGGGDGGTPTNNNNNNMRIEVDDTTNPTGNQHVTSFDKDDDSVELRKQERCVLEDFTQCSKSHLWKLMMSFYDRKGPESWSQGIVPHFITCNTFIGKSYAKVRIFVLILCSCSQ
jgi:hypothetical protein